MQLQEDIHGWFKGRRVRLTPLEAGCLLLIAVSVVFRIWGLARLPGFNGDEAWYGVQALRWADGAPVDWRTPTGNLVSPIQFGALALLHLVFDPAPWLLRFPTLISGLLTIPLVGYVAWRAFGRSAALLAALLCATLPVNIVHSRFGWDPSHLGLLAAFATWGAVRRNLLGVVLPFAFGLWVHPTQVFLAPFLALTFLGAALAENRRGRAWAMSGVAIVSLGLCTYALSVITSGGGGKPPLRDVLFRLTSAEEWLKQAVALSRYFPGDTTYEYISGARFPGEPGLWSALFWALIVTMLAFGVWKLARSRQWLSLGMVAGAFCTHLAFYLLAGPHMLAPHVERFGLSLVVPSLFALVALSTAEVKPPLERVRRLAWCAVALLLLVGYARYDVHAIHETGSTAHKTFWTGPEEPKVAAVERILSQRRPGAPLVIAADEWWTSWLVAYLIWREPEASHVRMPEGLYPPDTDVFLLGFPGGVEEQWVKRQGGAQVWERQDVPGYAREAVISIWRRR